MSELIAERFGGGQYIDSATADSSLKSASIGSQIKYLETSDLVKKFGGLTALDNISLTVNEGEFICFLGPSGCGKTTLLRVIAGLEYQTSGVLVQGGVNTSALPPKKRDFGIVFQSYALFPNLTVAKNVAYGLETRKVGKADIAEQVKLLLETVGLPDSEFKYPAQLSGGQQQRVALARALATTPGLLLLDEPLSALDAQVRVRLRREIRTLQKKLGVTTIMVTHDQEEAITMADRIVVMNHGIIEQVGTPEEIYQHPANAFVANFVGTANLLPCFVSEPECIDLEGVKLHSEYCDASLVGKKAQMAIRPEDIGVEEVSDNHLNSFDVIVEYIEFLGPFCRVGLVHKNGLELIAEFSMNIMRDAHIATGQNLKIRLPAKHLRLFPDKNN